MEILEAILKYFNIDKAKIDCLQAYFDNNKTLVLIVSSILTIILLRFLGKELLLILIPIAISSVIANFFRNKDKEEAQSIRDRDKEDTDARNLRAELREYFLTNIKPTIDEIVDIQNFKEYAHLEDKDGNPIDIKTLEKNCLNRLKLITKLQKTSMPLVNFATNISHKEYKKRFFNYQYIVGYILKLYQNLIYPQIINIQESFLSQKISSEKKTELIICIGTYIVNVECFLEEVELMLFNYNFDNDDSVFKKHMDVLDKAILNTKLDNAKDFLFNREELEKSLKLFEEYNNKTIETK